MVLEPIEPVAPRSDTTRGTGARSARANGFVCIIGLP
jgi:hypothetical protein